jgi:hypothetical protein
MDGMWIQRGVERGKMAFALGCGNGLLGLVTFGWLRLHSPGPVFRWFEHPPGAGSTHLPTTVLSHGLSSFRAVRNGPAARSAHSILRGLWRYFYRIAGIDSAVVIGAARRKSLRTESREFQGASVRV